MRLLRNFTLHRQGIHEQELASEAGFALAMEPIGVEVPPGLAGLSLAAHLLANRLDRCAADGTAALIGGHTAVWIVSLDLLSARGRRRPDLYYFETARRRDASGRFLFVPERLARVPGTFSSYVGKTRMPETPLKVSDSRPSYVTPRLPPSQ